MSAVDERRLYIYFGVNRDQEAAAVAAVRSVHVMLQSQSQSHGALECELLRRIDDGAGPVTLMEVWRQPGGVTLDAQARIERDAARLLAPWLVGVRHVEVFEPCA